MCLDDGQCVRRVGDPHYDFNQSWSFLEGCGEERDLEENFIWGLTSNPLFLRIVRRVELVVWRETDIWLCVVYYLN